MFPHLFSVACPRGPTLHPSLFISSSMNADVSVEQLFSQGYLPLTFDLLEGFLIIILYIFVYIY